jgi:cytochrome c5
MKESNYRFPILITVLVLLALAISCAAPAPTPTPVPTATEPSRITPLAPSTPTSVAADGETLMRSNCTTCHTLERTVSSKKTREQWEQTVTRMIRLSSKDHGTLIDYLAATYKP